MSNEMSSVEAIAAQPDPVGQVLALERRPNGLLAGQMRVPLGVVAMIYEARPNVTIEAAAMARIPLAGTSWIPGR